MDKLRTLEQLLRPAKGLILDFDGLLADSEKYHFLAYREVFERYGHKVDETEYYKYWTSLGHGAKGEIQRHNLALDPLAIRSEKMPIFTRYCEDGSISLYPDAKELLGVLSASGKTLAIASGSFTHDIRAILRNEGVGDLFATILGSDIVPAIKPAPDIFLRTMETLALTAAECVVFEDAEKGMYAAIEAGIPVIIVRTRETKDFDFGRADLVLDSHQELLKFAGAASL
ncbi:MAG: HAD family phosphatase [Candidatus Krumholzibacteria bacterium]|nr:HAD family phosphatase [Candidatus Krumholzibacteria bacterium]